MIQKRQTRRPSPAVPKTADVGQTPAVRRSAPQSAHRPHHGNRPPARHGGQSARPPARSGGQRGAPKKMHSSTNETFVVHPKDIKPPAEGVLRVMVLGGLEEVGRNCTLLEYGNDIILIDLGLQFPEEDMPGIDYIIPNISYLRGKEKHVKGVIVTHGHYDHIGGIPHIVPKIGNPPIYGLPITNAIIRKRQEDFKTAPLKMQDLKMNDSVTLGKFKVSLFHINHNIPDSAGILVETPTTRLIHTGDWKFDFHPVGTPPADFQRMALIGSQGVDVLMGDSTNAKSPGHTISEKVVGEELEHIIEKAPGRIVVGTFASLLSRVRQVIEIAERTGRVVAVDGFSMKSNVEIARELGYIKCKSSTIIKVDQVNRYPDNKVIIMCTGAQGESNAALMRIANREHRFVSLHEGDLVIFSSSVVPGNEGSVQRLTDTLYRQGADVISYKMMDVHASGHGHQEDIKLMISLFKPAYYVPIEGNHFLLKENAKIAYSLGWDKEHVFVGDNGQIMEFKGNQGFLRKEKAPTDYVFVDGIGVGDVSDVVLRDRNELAADGMIVIVTQVDGKTGNLVGSPDVISRGFVHMKDNQELITGIKKGVELALQKKATTGGADDDYIRESIRNQIGQFVLKKTERRPMILPVVIRV
ncbi:ribonuclease J [Candidatus Uhrbacteria bacterium CG10_big_fil_rev_8_21_14_0_10_50_16]|uniref:Ribonuclease J n=1 Tax=Candidatus Uhrbacteria bacterium CG10_big_fil_rev_8_21_14_0_10_50_16 TaxID=1975039 RepID=A0A2H0RL35_9BACT|nr:MAG: ribonuclease J [Candidatus Uhrbacteria bacterium CG10_big_fil_rev_8_21_14_0_10_50_16]